MNALTDQQLLGAYAAKRCEEAFAELVRRHVDLVHSAAWRLVRDPQLAEDVTQGVFVALAQNAGPLSRRPVLSAWLHRTARNLAANVVRSDMRRRIREQEAAAMNESSSSENENLWTQIAPHLDAALDELGASDREVLLLRYFERKSAREMAQVIGISDEAAQKRLSRALERLRMLFVRRGVTIGAAGLMTLLSTQAVHAAPTGMAATISSATGLAGSTAASSTLLTTFTMTTLQKTLVALTAVAVLGTGVIGVGVLVIHQKRQKEASLRAALTPRPTATEEEFSFQPGDHLDGPVAPALVGRAFTITTTFDAQGKNGVIIAQGGLAHGYALYVDGTDLVFAIRRNNELTLVAARPVTPGRHTATAHFFAEGELRLTLDNRANTIARAKGPITLVPADGLDVGADRGGLVGQYADANPFVGTIESVKLQLAPPAAP